MCIRDRNSVKPIFFSDKFAYLRRFKICDRNILWSPRILEATIEIGNLKPTAIGKGANEQRIPIITPAGARSTFFVHGKSFREPARNSIVSHLQSDHVCVFVPQSAAPIKFSDASSRWRVLSYHHSKTDTQGTKARYS